MGAELDRVRSGQPRVLWLSGPAGIGKTSLIRRLLGDQPGVCVLWGGGEESETGLPFGVLAQLVADVPRRLLGPLLAAGPAADADPLAVGAELLTVLGGLQAAGPVVIVVDDAQWVDDATGRALVFVGRRLRRDQVLVVVAARDDAPDGSAAWARNLAPDHLLHRVALGGLDAEEIVAAVRRGRRPGSDPGGRRRLRDHTGGHPLHATALLTELPPDALADTSRILPAPRSFAALVLVRVAKLSRPAQDLVVAAAVLGTRSALSDVVALAAAPDPLPALDESVRAGLLERGADRHRAPPRLPPRAGPRGGLRRPAARPSARAAPGRRRAARRLRRGGPPDRRGRRAGPRPRRRAHRTGPRRGRRTGAGGRRRTGSWRPRTSAARRRTGPARLVLAVGAMLAGGELARALRAEPDLRAGPATPGLGHVLGQLEALTGRFDTARETLTAALHTDGRRPGRARRRRGPPRAGVADRGRRRSRRRADGAGAGVRPSVGGRRAGPVRAGPRARHAGPARRRGTGAGAPPRRSPTPPRWRRPGRCRGSWRSGPTTRRRRGDPGRGRADTAPRRCRCRVGSWSSATSARRSTGSATGTRAAANGALAVSLVRDAGVLLGAGASPTRSPPTSPPAAGPGTWRRSASRPRPWRPSSCPGGAPGRTPRRRGRSSPRPAATTRRCTTPWRLRRSRRPRPRRPASACCRGGRCASRRCWGSAGSTRPHAALAELEERVAGRPPGLVGAGGGPAAVRDRGDTRGSRRPVRRAYDGR